MIKASEALQLSKRMSNMLLVIEQHIVEAAYLNRTFCSIGLQRDVSLYHQVQEALQQHGYHIKVISASDKKYYCEIHWNNPSN